ncbi:MAG TPA: hypothetical protein VKY74_14905 [Chloroflexia bacterium]|nr:hypothetical protein [Chloroflexia bacterium]
MDNTREAPPSWGEHEAAVRQRAGLDQIRPRGRQRPVDAEPGDAGSAGPGPRVAGDVERIHDEIPGFVDAGDGERVPSRNESVEG